MADTVTPKARVVESKKQRFERLRGQLDLVRQSFIAHWKELNDYILPRRGRFQVTDANKGDRRTRNIIDSTATFAARTLASGMMSGITSPARPWFRLTTPDPDLAEQGGVKEWLHDVEQRMATVFLRSNLYNVLPTVYGDLGVFGTAAMSVVEDDEDVIRCYVFPVGSYLIANDAKLRVRVFVREFTLTVRQIVDQFVAKDAKGEPRDWSTVSPMVKAHWENGTVETPITVVHVVAPNAGYDTGRLESRYKKFTSCYYERGGNAEATDQGEGAGVPGVLLEEKGYDEFPILVPRWEVTGEDAYATNCPGMTALGDIKQLQVGEKRGLQALEKMVNPPLVAQPGMRAAKLSHLPGDVSYVQDPDGKGLRPLHEVTFDLAGLEAKQAQVRERINRAFFADLFLMLAYTDQTRTSGQPVTATEIQERHEEKLLALGPVLEQLNQDLLDPLIDRVFNIMARRGLIPEAPEELAGMPLRVEYVSIMAQAQKMVGLQGLERHLGFLAQVAEVTATGAPSLDKTNFDEMIAVHADASGVPPKVVRSDDEVEQDRQAKQQQAAEMAQSESMATQATAAKTLSETNTQQPSALTDLLAQAKAGSPLPVS